MITISSSSRSSSKPLLHLLLSSFLLLQLFPAPTTAFLPPAIAPATPSPQSPSDHPHHLPLSQLSSAPMTDGGSRTRSSIFPPPLMSFYGEQRRKLQEEAEAKQMEWANYFNELIVTQGQELCVCGYEGYLRSGSKGAVAVYCDEEGGGEGLQTCSSLSFTTLEELLADPRMDGEIKEQVTERVMSYDPDFEVAVLFAHFGQVGLNVLRPTYPPKFLYETLKGKR